MSQASIRARIASRTSTTRARRSSCVPVKVLEVSQDALDRGMARIKLDDGGANHVVQGRRPRRLTPALEIGVAVEGYQMH